jgi:hypothetical protein
MDLLLSPSLVFSVLLASLYGAIFHFIWGKKWRDLALFWAAAIVGFGIGQAIFGLLNFSAYMIGEVRIVESTILSWGCLFIARWLKV